MSFRSLFTVRKNHPAYVVAEIGGNFNRFEEAVALIDAAGDVGADCVKLQTYRAETLASKSAFFDMENTGKISQYAHFKKSEISKELHERIFRYAEKKGLDWFSTPSHSTDVDMLEALGAEAYKIGADDAVNIPFLRYVAKKRKPIFLSTGMCTLEEIRESVAAILREGNQRIGLFHTVSIYPTYPEDVNLNAIRTLQNEFPGFLIGYSDHTRSPLACIAALAVGARVIEKHFTLDKNAAGPDHALSATPDEMRSIVESARSIEKMMGSGVKAPVGAEIRNRANNRKSLVATHAIRKGETFSDKNIACKRPGTGIPPKYFCAVVGKKAAGDIPEDTLITWQDVRREAG